MRLNDASLPRLAGDVERPHYDRGRTSAGIVHLGPGTFHRAHQAVFADSALRRDHRLAICGVSLRSPGVRDALAPQDGLYTLAIVDKKPGFRVIGSIREILVAPEDPDAVLDRLSHPDVHTVTLTVTEKGYCLGADGNLDLSHADIRTDLGSPWRPCSAIGYLVAGLGRRRGDGIPPFAVVSCDNLAANGSKLGTAVRQLAAELDGELGAWIAGEVRFPDTMVDSITPATDDPIRTAVAEALGLRDAWPVQRERFVQWVVAEGQLPHENAWRTAGVTFSNDVAGYENVKLRILNGQHTPLAYLGIVAGYRTVAEAVADADLGDYLEALSVSEIQPSIRPPDGLDLGEYSRSIIRRFENPLLEHRLEQIAIDGSQKIPIRILGTLRDNLAAGRPIRCLCLAIAGWLHFLGTRRDDGSDLDDPLAERLLAIHRRLETSTADGIRAFLELQPLCGRDLRESAGFADGLVVAYDALRGPGSDGVGARVRAYLADGH